MKNQNEQTGKPKVYQVPVFNLRKFKQPKVHTYRLNKIIWEEWGKA